VRRALAAQFLAILLAVAPPATAQVSVSLYGRSGLSAPDTYFYEIYQNFLEGQTTWTTASLGRSFTAGGGMEVGFEGTGIRIRAEGLYTFDSWVRLSYSKLIPRVFFDPPSIVTDWHDIPFNMAMSSVQLVFPTRLKLWGAEPYVAVGGGGKYYQFGEPTEAADSAAILPKDGFTWGGDAGAGVVVPFFGGLSGDFQARTAITRYWGKTQTDFIYSGALMWRIH